MNRLSSHSVCVSIQNRLDSISDDPFREILPKTLLLLLFFSTSLLMNPNLVQAQFLDLQLQLDSELTATTEQPLYFGVQQPNSGRIEIPLGAANMGIFSIRALENQNLLVTLTLPSELPHDNLAVDEAIPLNLAARYGYSAQNVENSQLLPQTNSSITVASTPGPGPWSIFYIFVYGSMNIGTVPGGNYGSEILLSIEYI